MKPFNSLLVTLIALAVLGLIWFPGDQPDSSASNQDNQNSQHQLHKQLAQMQQQIDDLNHDLQQQRQLTAQIHQQLQQLQSTGMMENNTQEAPPPIPERGIRQTEPASGSRLKDNLIASGLAADTIQNIEQIISQRRLEMLELRNRAKREGWDNTVEYSEKMHELQDPSKGVQEQFGDDVYDQYLYASNRPNRVAVQQVYSGSAAELAGIEVGDLIISYANQRIFHMGELQQVTIEGTAGESVLIEVQRDGLPVALTVPRGPLGISMSIKREQP